MANYVKATNFYTKDALSTGNPAKIIKGAEIDDEFNAIATAVNSKADITSPTFSGTPLAPTATAGTNSTQIATTAFVAASQGTMASQNKTAVDITGGTIVGITDLLPADGGTGVSTLTKNAIIIGNGTGAVTSITPSTNGNVLTSIAGATVNAGSFVVGTQYTILSAGSTSWTSIGAASNTVGEVFTATGVGTGNGTATTNIWSSQEIPVQSYPLTNATATTTTSGTYIDVTGLPSWVKRVTVQFLGVSTSGTSPKQIQLIYGSSTVVSSGYNATSSRMNSDSLNQVNASTGLIINAITAVDAITGYYAITNITGNSWVGIGAVSSAGGTGYSMAGGVSISGTLTGLRFTTVNGTDTFDAGTINILYE